MSTKAQFNTARDANWGDTTSPKRVPSNDRTIANAISAELWSTVYHETLAGTPVITTLVASNCTYDLIFSKTGNRVLVSGKITNLSLTSLPAGTILDFTNSDFNGRINVGEGISSQTFNQNGVFFTIDGAHFKIGTALAGGAKAYVNFTYLTND